MPPGVLNTLVETGLAAGPVVRIAAVTIWLWLKTAAQVGRLDCLDIDHVVCSHEGERRLMVEVAPLSAHMLMGFRQPADGFSSAVAALLPAGHMPLGLLQCLLRFAVVTGILDDAPIRSDEKDLQPHVNAGLLPDCRERMLRHIRTGDATYHPSAS